jgi:hypothetical protein
MLFCNLVLARCATGYCSDLVATGDMVPLVGAAGSGACDVVDADSSSDCA